MAVMPLTLANAIIDHAAERGEFVTPMKLQKLMYFAHGFHLASYGVPAIDEGFEAWPYGPVNRQTYEAYASYENRPITAAVWATGFRSVPRLDLLTDTVTVKQMAETIWDRYATADAIRLSQITHLRNSPWSRIRDNHSGNLSASMHVPIPDDDIKRYFECVMQRGYEGALDANW